MKIILTRDVSNLGQAGDVKDVAAGYARNYLIPQGMAIKTTPGALKEFKRHRVAESRREERMAVRAHALAERLSALTLTFEAKSGETGRLYGSVTPDDIAAALERETGEKFDRRKHILSDPIREVGEHAISVRLMADVVAEVKVVVKPEGGELPEPTPDASADGSAPEDGVPSEWPFQKVNGAVEEE
ncbi:MAG: 50S ribosomal protein L9 [Chloroflexi bacterium]|nr:MAG: 50S ribosomal protein L9 [Anaerolineaceae bacterium 4572_32.2]RLC77091.1 MAG: 50S ribosomal protein L9 [Chloroflexota bacterium]RLC84568.1 MAG: 50S ribosomal protein L9 [Chloroflexota bacterium]